jgi:hypothetical protein
VWDCNYRFSQPSEHKTVTALKDKAGDLWVVGAAVFRGLGVKTVRDELNKDNANFYAKVGEVLCGGGRPPEGIAIIDATINALTGYRQTDVVTFNWNKANQRDIFQLLAKLYDVTIPYSVREAIVVDVVAERKKSDFGLNNEAVLALFKQLKTKYRLNIDLHKLPGCQKEIGPFDWNVATQREIFQLLAKLYELDIPFSVREAVAAAVYAERTRNNGALGIAQVIAVFKQLKVKYNLKIDLRKLPGCQDA